MAKRTRETDVSDGKQEETIEPEVKRVRETEKGKIEYIPLLPEDKRLTVYPIARQDLWDLYKTASQCYWVVEEVDLSNDRSHYVNKLSPGQRHFVDFVLSFFAVSDKIVNINLAKRFKEELPLFEAEMFYDFQIAMENIHAEMYALQLEAIIPDTARRTELLNGIETIPVIAKMGAWMRNCIASEESLPIRLLRMACVEGIFFTSCFCAIYWLKNLGLMPGLGHANEFIARDEGLHTRFALHLFTLVSPSYQPKTEEIVAIVAAAVTLAKEFAGQALPQGLSEMNEKLMGQYIECVADNLLSLIGQASLYNTANPFQFMVQLNIKSRENFFERRSSNYSKTKKAIDNTWGLTEF